MENCCFGHSWNFVINYYNRNKFTEDKFGKDIPMLVKLPNATVTMCYLIGWGSYCRQGDT